MRSSRCATRPGPHQTADESQWKLKSSDELLSLKVADIACGSGAFLVAAARYLADRVVEAWTAEDPANAHRRDLHLEPSARSSPTASTAPTSTTWPSRCASSPSGWFRSIATCRSRSSTTRSSSATRCSGSPASTNSASCTSTRRACRPATMFDIFDVDIDAIIRKAVDLRRNARHARSTRTTPPATAPPNAASSPNCTHVTADLRKIADGVIAAGLPLGGKPGKALDEAYENLRIAVKAAHPESGEPDSSHLDTIIDSRPHTHRRDRLRALAAHCTG